MNKISAVINTYNESYLLEDCVKSIKGFADEIIVGDMMSTDGSGELAKNLGCKVIYYEWEPIVEYKLSALIKAASFEWILLFDPDMRLSKETSEKLSEIIQNDKADAVQFYLKNRVFGKYIFHGHASQGFYLKLFKKSVFLENGEPEVKIHSMLYDAIAKKTNRVLKLNKKYPIEHIAYNSIYKCFEQHLRYAKADAEERFQKGDKFSFLKMTFEFVKKIIKDFIFLSAWKSGMRGMVYSMISEIMILQIHFFLWEKSKK